MVYRTGEAYVGHEVPVRLERDPHRGVEEVWATFVYQANRDASGNVVGVDVFGFEVTEQVEAKQRAEALVAELARRAAFEEQLIGVVSHDLRNPINAIVLGTLVLQDAALSEGDAIHLGRIRRAAERAHLLIRDLLDFTQARLGGGLRVQRRSTDLAAVARDVSAELRTTHAGRDVHLVVDGDVNGEWDADRLGQLLQNLLSNALRYSPPTSDVALALRREEDVVVVVVHNVGAPIPAERHATLFEPLQRAVGQVDPTSRSLGLGLYIVKQVVNAHGGRLSMTSTADDGTTFTVRLPVGRAGQPETTKPTEASTSSARTRSPKRTVRSTSPTGSRSTSAIPCRGTTHP